MADIDTLLSLAAGDVVIVKAVLLDPSFIVALAGTWAIAGAPLESVIVLPPLGALPNTVIIALAELPPTTATGSITKVASLGGRT